MRLAIDWSFLSSSGRAFTFDDASERNDTYVSISLSVSTRSFEKRRSPMR